MERQRNWLGIVAVVLAGLALVVALGGRFGPGSRQMAYYSQAIPAAPAAPAAPQAPSAPMGGRFERGPGAMPPEIREQLERELGRGEGFGRGFAHGRGEGFGPGFHGRGGPESFGPGFGHGRHGFSPLGMIFGLANAVTKIVALGLLAWLLLRLYQQRGAPPAAPTTPAGHDPRVE